jgi:uncharacterized protein involved in exopolysaccharide biosynthesis
MDEKKLDPVAQAKECWQFVVRKKWAMLFGGAFLGSVLLVALIVLLPPRYSASMTVLVDPQAVPSVSSITTMDAVRFDTLAQQVLSTTRLGQIVDELNLCPPSLACPSKQAYVESMSKAITIVVKSGGDRNLSAFTITYIGSDPKKTAEIVRRLADSFIQWDMATRGRQASRVREFLVAEQMQAKQALDDREARLSQFKLEHVYNQPGAPVLTNNAELNALKSQFQAKTAALSRLEQATDSMSPNTNTHSQEVQAERASLEEQQRRLVDQLTTLRTRYSDDYPDVEQANARLQAVQNRIAELTPVTTDPAEVSRLAGLNSEMARLREERTRLQEQIDNFQVRSSLPNPMLQFQMDDLVRDLTDAKSRYMSLFDKNVWAETATELEHKQDPGRFTTLDPPQVPDAPIVSKKRLLIPFMIPLGFVLSVVLVIAYEKFIKGTMGTEFALQAVLPPSVAVLGRIPVIETIDSRRSERKMAAVAVAGSIVCLLGAAAYLKKLPMITFTAGGSVLFCMIAILFLKLHPQKPGDKVSS